MFNYILVMVKLASGLVGLTEATEIKEGLRICSVNETENATIAAILRYYSMIEIADRYPLLSPID
jgi:hypothetical protein